MTRLLAWERALVGHCQMLEAAYPAAAGGGDDDDEPYRLAGELLRAAFVGLRFAA